jgi:hypothetical protein
MSKIGHRLQTAFAKLDAAYAELPTIQCQGKCAVACGPIVLTDLEARRLQLATHVAPRVVHENRCVYLTQTERCRAYAVRPLICRVWGLVRMLSCMHGCLPDRWLKDEDFLRLAQTIERFAGGRVLRTGPHGLEDHGESYGRFGRPTKSPAAIEATAERTRSLRALHGGRIILAVDDRD